MYVEVGYHFNPSPTAGIVMETEGRKAVLFIRSPHDGSMGTCHTSLEGTQEDYIIMM